MEIFMQKLTLTLILITMIITSHAAQKNQNYSKKDFNLIYVNNPDEATKEIIPYFFYTLFPDFPMKKLKDISPNTIRSLFYDFFKAYQSEENLKNILQEMLREIGSNENLEDVDASSKDSLRGSFHNFLTFYVLTISQEKYNKETRKFDADVDIDKYSFARDAYFSYKKNDMSTFDERLKSFIHFDNPLKFWVDAHEAVEKYNEENFQSFDEVIYKFTDIYGKGGQPLSPEIINKITYNIKNKLKNKTQKDGILHVSKFLHLQDAWEEDEKESDKFAISTFVRYLKESLPRDLYPNIHYINNYDEGKVINLFHEFFAAKAESDKENNKHWENYLEDVRSTPEKAKEAIIKYLNEEGFPVKSIDEQAFKVIGKMLVKKFDGIKGMGRFTHYIKDALNDAPKDSIFLKQCTTDNACLLSSRLAPALQIEGMRKRLQRMIVDETDDYIDFKFPPINGPKTGRLSAQLRNDPLFTTIEHYNIKNQYIYRVKKKLHKSSVLPIRGRVNKISLAELSPYDLWFNTFSKAYLEYSDKGYKPKNSYNDFNNFAFNYMSSLLFSRGIHISQDRKDLEALVFYDNGDIEVVVNVANFLKDYDEDSSNFDKEKRKIKINIKDTAFIHMGTGHATTIYYNKNVGSWMFFDNQRVQNDENGEPITPEHAKEIVTDERKLNSHSYILTLIFESDDIADRAIENRID